jgi:hypothetical protein
MADIRWESDPEFWGATYAEHALIGVFELVAFDLPPHQGEPRVVGWELYSGEDLSNLIAKGNTETFEAAKAAAEATYRAREN